MAVFWVVAPCSLLEVYCCFRGAYCLHHHRPDDGGSKHLWKIGKLLPNYTVQQPRIQPFSYSLLWEPQISTDIIIITGSTDLCGPWSSSKASSILPYLMPSSSNSSLLKTWYLGPHYPPHQFRLSRYRDFPDPIFKFFDRLPFHFK
jgi:hypothetical protein